MPGDPRVERRDRLLEQRDLRKPRLAAPPARSARAPPRRTMPARSGRWAVVSSRRLLRGARCVVFHASRRCVRMRADASTGERRGPSSTPHGRSAAVRSTDGLASHDFAEAICRAGTSAPWSRANMPTTTSGRSSQGRRDACRIARSASPESRGTTAASGAGPISPGADELRHVEDADRAARVASTASAEFVVPRSIPTRRRWRWLSRLALTDVQLELPALRPSRRHAPELHACRFRSRGSRASPGRRRALAAVHLQRHVERAQLLEIVARSPRPSRRRDRSCAPSS